MPPISDFAILFYILLLILMGGIYFLGYAFHYAIEESRIITLRLRVSLLLGVTFGLPAYCFFVFDMWHINSREFANNTYQLDLIHYYAVLVIFAGGTLYRFFRYAEFEDLVFLALISIFILRVLFDTSFVDDVFYWVFFTFILYYGLFVIKHWAARIKEAFVIGLLFTVLSWGISFFVVDSFRSNGYYATYIGCIFVSTLWIRYLWNLEYKRRKRCPACGGWGKLGYKEKKRFWWAIGYKESSNSKNCETCQGKGWQHKYPDLFHGEPKNTLRQ